MVDTTGNTNNDPYQPVFVIHGQFRGVLHIRYDCEKEKLRRDNMIANRGLPKVRTDDAVEPVQP